MNLRQVISTDMTASAVAHLAALALVVLFSEVHPFGAVTAEPIAIDIVTPQEVEKKAEPAPAPTPLLDFSALEEPAAASAPGPAPQSAPARPQKQAALAAPRASRQATAAPQAASPTPTYTPPEPDLSIKYHVLLGLPPDLSPDLAAAPPPSGVKAGANFDAPATKAADVASSLVAEFRRHLRTCSRLPESVTASDNVKVTLRVFMTPDGKLATDPILIEASASMKGPLLMQGAISALQACQPYAMLPVDRYSEWKVIDLSFTPQDFAS
jgi:outer membrane biosynthesis protein TonB